MRALRMKAAIAVLCSFCAASSLGCSGRGKSSPSRATSVEPPARVVAATDGRVSLQASAYVELHALLATAAREGLSDDDALALEPELKSAINAYKRSLQDDDDDVIITRSTRALSACTDDACALKAVEAEGFGRGFSRALPAFVTGAGKKTRWLPRATASWIGIEAAHGALTGRAESATAIYTRVASDLGITLPETTGIRVDVVSETPPIGRKAFLPMALATRGRCFLSEQEHLQKGHPAPSEQREHVHHARILDCILVHALLNADQSTPIRLTLVRLLGDKEGERAWTLLVIHAVAATITGWEPKHLSVYRRSATAIEPEMLSWLVQQWHGKPTGDADDFSTRYAAAWKEQQQQQQQKIHSHAN